MSTKLTARLEDLTSELEALRLFRRKRIITNIKAFNKEKQRLLKSIKNVEEDIEINRRSLEIAKELKDQEERRKIAQQKRNFLSTVKRKFRSGKEFTILLGNNFISDFDIFELIVRQAGRWTLQAGETIYLLNDKTRVRLRDILIDAMITEEEIKTSDGNFLAILKNFGQVSIAPFVATNKYTKDTGAFFKYTHTTHYDFSRYGIFSTIDPNNYYENCLIGAFILSGLSSVHVEDMKLRIKNRNIPKKDLKEIAEIYNICIILRTANQEKQRAKPFVFGSLSSETKIHLGLLDNHYFLIEKTTNTRYSLEHYNEIKEEKNDNSIIKKKKGLYYERDEKRYIDSYDLVKILLEQKDTLLNEITMNDQLIATTQFYDKVDKEIKDLSYDETLCIRPVSGGKTIKKENLAEYKNVFFDFETYTKDGVHVPYLVVTYDGTTKKTFYGETCGYQMLQSLDVDTRLIAHNATYDYRFIIQYLTGIEELSRGNRLISCSASFEGCYIEIKDSYHLISMGLKKFPQTFGIKNIVKEVMPYELYSEDSVKQRWFSPEYVATTFIKDDDRNQFHENIKRWKLLNSENQYDIVEYSRRYCEIDCEILFQGYTTFREWILNLVKIDIDGVLTVASLSHKYFVKQGCYAGVAELSGIPQMFIQGCVVGGRTMCSENKKIKIEGKINDFDAVSLYPSAMNRMDGFLKGIPKILTNLTYDFLKKQDGYFVDIRITGVGVKRKFPLVSTKNEEGVRIFSNDVIGSIIRVDRYSLEDLIQFQGLTFEVLRGYYFNEGFNTKIKKVIKFLFDERLRMKKEGNPAQEVYKLIMNSGYGKSIMKAIEERSFFFDNEDEFKVFLSRNYNWVSSYVRFGTKIKVNGINTLSSHFNIAQVGTTILSMSKRIMNEVMCLAEDNNLDVYYQDTDSNHILDKDIEVLADLFEKKYGRELIGKGFGQFHSDFEIQGTTDVYSRKAIFLGKKCYIDELVGMNKDGKEVIDYHIRMKGIPNSCILYTAEKLGYSTPFELYEDLYKGKAISFDLTNDGTKANFKFQKDYSVNTMSMFARTIKFA